VTRATGLRSEQLGLGLEQLGQD